MFLHLREKTKFIHYNRRNPYIRNAGRKIAASSEANAEPKPPIPPISPIYSNQPPFLKLRATIRQILPIVPIFLKERAAVGRYRL